MLNFKNKNILLGFLLVIFVFLFIIVKAKERKILLFVNLQNIVIKNNSKLNPVNLKIPIIGVVSKVEHVGITKDGAVDAPSGPKNVGWYNLGPRPGENGVAIIDGHSGWKGNLPAVFDNLYKLRVDDKIYIEDSLGNILVFNVIKIKIYTPGEDYTDVFVPKSNGAYLNLITCSGLWNNIKKSSPDRLVIFTELVKT